MKIKKQTRKLAAGCSKHCFEVVDRTDEVSSKYCFEVVDETDEVSSKYCFEVVDETDEVSNHTYGKAKLTWFEEIFVIFLLYQEKGNQYLHKLAHLLQSPSHLKLVKGPKLHLR